jgi:hypothetical protein
MGAAAQLARPRAVADLHDPDDVAVLLAEQRHGAQAPRLVERHRQRADRLVERDLGVDAVLHVPDVLVAQRGAVGEVEAQLVRADVRTGLAHVRAQALAQRGVQQVRGRVVALGGVADRRRHTRDHPRALAQRPVLDLEHDGLVVAEAQHVGHPSAAVAVLALDHAGVGDLPAAGGVERRLGELDEHPAVHLVDRADGRVLLERLVARERRRRPHLAPERRRARRAATRRPTRRPADAMPPRDAWRCCPSAPRSPLVDARALLGDDLERQVDREAERVVQRKACSAPSPRRRAPWPARSGRRAASCPARACGRTPPPRRSATA